MSRLSLLGAVLLGATTVSVGGAATTHGECAALVPQADVARGKSAFFSGCYPSSGGEVPSGCWSPGQYNPGQNQFPPETASQGYGCQTCVMTNAKFAGAVFPVYWAAGKRDHLAPCPENQFNYAAFHAASPVVSAASITNAAECPAGWFWSNISGRCYWKSDRYSGLAGNWDKANEICRGMGAALVTLESAAENDWFISNLLWPGVMGETFTALWHDAPGKGDGNWHWVDSPYVPIAPFGPGSFRGWYPGMSDATIYPTPDNFADRRSCMEIYPQIPKGWNPFSCSVNKQYACVRRGASGGGGSPVPAPTPMTGAPVVAPMAAPKPTGMPTPVPGTCPLCNIGDGDRLNGLGANLDSACANGGIGCSFGGVTNCRLCVWDTNKAGVFPYLPCQACVKQSYCAANQIPAASCSGGPGPTPKTIAPTPAAVITPKPTTAGAVTPKPSLRATAAPTTNGGSTCSLCSISDGDIGVGLGASIDATCATDGIGCNFGGSVAYCRLCIWDATKAGNFPAYKACPSCVKASYCASGRIPASKC